MACALQTRTKPAIRTWPSSPRVRAAWLQFPALRVSKAHKVKLAPPVRKVKPVPLVLRAKLARKANKAHKVKLVRWVLLVNKGHRAKPALLVLPVSKVRKVKLVPLVRKANRDHKVKLVRWAPPVNRVHRAKLVPPA